MIAVAIIISPIIAAILLGVLYLLSIMFSHLNDIVVFYVECRLRSNEIMWKNSLNWSNISISMGKRNYQKELDAIIAGDKAKGIRPRLLIHSCCAPCSSYVMEYLREHFELTMYFYNPNMDTQEEYNKRAEELKRLIRELNEADPIHPIKCVIEDYDPQSFDRIAKGHEDDPERGARCLSCYALRLNKTAEYMQKTNQEYAAAADAAAQSADGCNDRAQSDVCCDEAQHNPAPYYDYFATTLTLSPLKSAEALNDIAEQIAAQKQLKALPTDFKKREGYKRSIELSHIYGLYRQNYCGCRFSKAEALRRASESNSAGTSADAAII